MVENSNTRKDMVIVLSGKHGFRSNDDSEDFTSRIPFESFSSISRPLQEVLLFFKKYPSFFNSYNCWKEIQKAENLTEEECWYYQDKICELMADLVDKGINFPSFEDDLFYNIELKEIFVEEVLQIPFPWEPYLNALEEVSRYEKFTKN